MGVVKKIPRPHSYPGRTVWGSVGECVFVGDVIPGNGNQPGIGVFLSERECREVLAAWGWPTPEKHTELEQQHGELEEERDALVAEVERLNGLCDELQKQQPQVVSIEDVQKWMNAPSATASAAPKSRQSSKAAA